MKQHVFGVLKPRFLPLVLLGAIVNLPLLVCGREAKPVLKWKFHTGSRIYSSPVVGDFGDRPGDEILTSSSEERKLICLGSDQKVQWTYDDFILRLTSTPTIADIDGDGHSDIIIATRESGVVCLDRDGKLIRKIPVQGGISWGSITAKDLDGDGKPELVWITDEGKIECHRADSQTVWEFDTPNAPAPLGPPAAGDVNLDGKSEVVCVGGPQTLYCLDHGGQLLWKLDSLAPFTTGPVIADVLGDEHPEVLCVSIDGIFFCLDGGTGNILWNYRTLRTRIDTTIAVGDVDADGNREILFGDGLGYLYCLKATGNEAWSYKSNDWIESTPVLGDIDGDGEIEILFGSADGNLYCLSSQGEAEWIYKIGKRIAASPALCDYDQDGITDILIPAHDGYLYCLTMNAKWEPSAMLWPFRRYDFQQTGCLPPK